MITARVPLLFVLALAACSGSIAPVDPCTAQIDAIGARLEAAARVADPSGAPWEIPLPRGRGGVPLEGAPPLLVVGDDGVRLAGRGVGGGEDVERLAVRIGSDLRLLAESEEVGDGSAWTVALWSHPELRAGRLVALLAGAPPNVRFAILLRAEDVRAPRARNPPPWVRQAVRTRPSSDALERRERIEEAWARATERCAPAQEHLPMPAVLDATGPPMGAPSVGALVESIRRCGCEGQDLPAIEAVALAALVSAEGPLVRMPHALRFGPAVDDGRELRVAADLDASALIARIASTASDSLVFVTVE